MADRKDLPKSIFNFGTMRHNVVSQIEAKREQSKSKNLVMEPVRLLEWKENTGRQKYDKPVTAKI